MAKPIIAIVGRPNVGKSTFFNYVSGRRLSIVEDTPGVTRDRIYADGEWRNRNFTMIDTGGIEPESEDMILRHMRKQAEIAIDMSDVILFMVDRKDGLTETDKDVSDILRKSQKPVILVVNKVDSIGNLPADCYEFFNLGMGDFFPVSSVHGHGIGDLLDECYKYFPVEDDDCEEDMTIKTAVIGKPNVGKSSLINFILGEERVIVSDVAGTTRDAVDTVVQRGDDTFTFIDTAGIRRKSKIEKGIERYSIIRAFNAVDRSDVCILMIDAEEGVTEQDTKIAGYAHEEGKAIIVAVNKWDLIEKETGTFEEYKKKVKEKLGFMLYAPVHIISVKTGRRVNNIFTEIKRVYENSRFRISTGMLNDFLDESTATVQPPSDKGKRLKIYYMTQNGICPPTFVFFCNRIDLFHFSYQRYIENQLRKSFGFEGTPIKFILREKNREDV